MHDKAGSVETASAATSLVPLPPATPAPAPRRRGAMRLLVAPFLFLRRHLWRALSAMALLALCGGATGLLGLFVWTEHHLRAARRAIERGHNGVAIRHLHACRWARPDHPEVLLLCARVARRSGAWTEAEAFLDRYWQLRGDDEPLVLERLLLRATGGEVEAVWLLLQARIDAGGPEAALAREALVAGLLYRFRLRDAATQIERWLEAEPDSPLALFASGKLHEQREQSSDALRTFRRLVEIDPEHDEARLRLTALLLQMSQGEEALAHLEHLRKRLPHNPNAMTQLAQALDLQGRADEARAVLDDCLARHPDHPAALAERGRLAYRDGDGQAAEEFLRRAVQLDPSDVRARNHYQLALGGNGKKAEAAKEREALRRIEADIQRIGIIARGRLQEAPNDPGVPYEVALIALRAGRPKEAHRWLQNALRIDPNHAPTHRALAAYYHETGNPILSARHRALAQRFGGPQKP